MSPTLQVFAVEELLAGSLGSRDAGGHGEDEDQ